MVLIPGWLNVVNRVPVSVANNSITLRRWEAPLFMVYLLDRALYVLELDHLFGFIHDLNFICRCIFLLLHQSILVSLSGQLFFQDPDILIINFNFDLKFLCCQLLFFVIFHLLKLFYFLFIFCNYPFQIIFLRMYGFHQILKFAPFWFWYSFGNVFCHLL